MNCCQIQQRLRSFFRNVERLHLKKNQKFIFNFIIYLFLIYQSSSSQLLYACNHPLILILTEMITFNERFNGLGLSIHIYCTQYFDLKHKPPKGAKTKNSKFRSSHEDIIFSWSFPSAVRISLGLNLSFLSYPILSYSILSYPISFGYVLSYPVQLSTTVFTAIRPS